MLSKELIKEVMSTEEYKNRPTHWVSRKTDLGMFISENNKVFVGTLTECRDFIEKQVVTEVDRSYNLYSNDAIIVSTTGRRSNVIRSAYDFCYNDYDVLGDEIKAQLEVNQMINAVQVEFYLYGTVDSGTFLDGLKRCNCCGKYHTVQQYTNGSQYCNSCAIKYTKCPICGHYILKSDLIDFKAIKTPLTSSEKMRYAKGSCKSCIDSLTNEYKRAGYYHDAPSDAPLFYNASRKNTPLASESDSGTRYFGIEFEYAIGSDDLYSKYSEDDYDTSDDCLTGAVEHVLSELAKYGYDRHIYSESDSSIEPYGYEFITNPMSLDYLMTTDVIKRIVNTTANAYFYDDESCGMHIHVNRGSLNKYSVAKMNMILTSLEYRQDYIISKISGRYNGCDEWSKIVNFSDAYYCSNTEERYACIYEQMRGNGRYVALNSQNKNTIEFRFFGSTMDISLIKYRLYFVNALCSYANNHTLEHCMNCGVADITEWDNRCKPLFDRYL
jgi:hypothetical protein